MSGVLSRDVIPNIYISFLFQCYAELVDSATYVRNLIQGDNFLNFLLCTAVAASWTHVRDAARLQDRHPSHAEHVSEILSLDRIPNICQPHFNLVDRAGLPCKDFRKPVDRVCWVSTCQESYLKVRFQTYVGSDRTFSPQSQKVIYLVTIPVGWTHVQNLIWR